MNPSGTLRDWEVRNQGQQPLSGPSPKTATEADIAAPTESKHPNGDVTVEPGATGSSDDGAMRGTGSRGGTGSPTTKAV